MGLPGIAKIVARGSERGSASERSTSEPVVPRIIRAAEVAYLTLCIQISLTREFVGLPAGCCRIMVVTSATQHFGRFRSEAGTDCCAYRKRNYEYMP